jgi:hypothetical protein
MSTRLRPLVFLAAPANPLFSPSGLVVLFFYYYFKKGVGGGREKGTRYCEGNDGRGEGGCWPGPDGEMEHMMVMANFLIDDINKNMYHRAQINVYRTLCVLGIDKG